ncbi:hypothetical protein BT63DRAFT_377181, partial [Microthyrium microscopicum]
MEQQEGHRPIRRSAYDSPTFDKDVQIRVSDTVGSASISPSGRDVVLASREGLHIVDLDLPYSQPRHLVHHSLWDVADVQWSPFASKDYWIVSTSNQKALVWNLNLPSTQAPIEHILHAHSRAITDINFSAHDPEMLATCAVDSYVHCWDLRHAAKPAMTFADWHAGATQVKWNRQNKHIIASSHDKYLKIWDTRKGAYPLKTIEAHSTKIYGIDWNRTRETGIVTCSLDRTIKFWDYSESNDQPERVIRTSFPVWRARHTPFGWGLLAMPQRGDFNLHLYDRRLEMDAPRDGYTKPVHSFSGHQEVVKEFLWRQRGSVENGMDNRDFQLISWGYDRDLHLHRMEPKYLNAVGHEKGKEVRNKLVLTRLGAVYQSFRDEKLKSEPNLDASTRGSLRPQGAALLSAAFKLGKAPIGQTLAETGFMTASFNTFGRKRAEKAVNPMKWIEGVKISNRVSDDHRGSRIHVDTPEPLSEEFKEAGKRYRKVKFEKAEVHERVAVVTLHGPWGQDDKSEFFRVHFEFPQDYPQHSTPRIQIDKSTSAVADIIMQKLYEEVWAIADHYQSRGRGCLEAVITYLLGEKDLSESVMFLADGPDGPFTSPAEELSSDDEDGLGAEEDLEASGTILTGQSLPLPARCGAVWSGDGRLVCFFPPKALPPPAFSLDAIRMADRGRRLPKQFEGFGHLREESVDPKDRSGLSDDDEDKSTGSWTDTSSSSSSDDSEDIGKLPDHFKVPMAWRPSMLRSLQKPSSHSSGGVTRKADFSKEKAIISIHDFSDILPAKRALAEEYQMFGDGPKVCQHNSEVALRLGLPTLSAVWVLCREILYDDVPLEELDQHRRNDPILVLARRNVVRIKRKDSGLDLGFDEPDTVANAKLKGRVKWGNHPFASAWLIPKLFEHYELQADIQMLAMLSCVFCEPAAQEGINSALLALESEDLPIAVKAPAFSLDYFPSTEVAWSQFQERRLNAKLATPTPSQYTDYFGRQHTTFGSLGSSNGPWIGDLPTHPPTPYTGGHTPPLSRQDTIGSSLSTSPEPNNRISRRSNSSLSTAFASFSRPFTINMSSSPPVKRMTEADLSTSAPNSAFTLGLNTSYGSSPNEDSDELTDDDEEVPTMFDNAKALTPTIKVTLKNQHRFDDEGYASKPLLDPTESGDYVRYRTSYAHLLGRWQLHIAQAEILKFNGL